MATDIGDQRGLDDGSVEMTTLEEVARALEAMRVNQAQHEAELLRLRAENDGLRANMANGAGGPVQQVVENLTAVVQNLAAVTAETAARGNGSRSLIDTKGLGRPPAFKNEHARFNEWLRKTVGFATAAFGSTFRRVLEWAEDQERPITEDDLEDQFGVEAAAPEDRIDDLREKDAQLHVALQALTEGESFDIVLGCAPRGVEALRRLARRWDPSSGGRRRATLKQILVPERAKLTELPAALEKWDELVRRYTRPRAGGEQQKLDEDILVSSLESLVPADLEQHLAVNRSRLPTYDKVREEIEAYLEAKQSQGVVRQSRGPKGDPMDVDSLRTDGKGKHGKGKNGKGKHKDGKGKQKGDGKGHQKTTNPDMECWSCGRRGHLSRECRSKGAASGGKGWNGAAWSLPSGGGGGKGKGKGKKAIHALEDAPADYNDDAGDEQAALSLDFSAFGLNAVSGEGGGFDGRGWLKFTYDTGAAITAFPPGVGRATGEANENTYATASGEIIEDQGGAELDGTTELGKGMRLAGRRADVKKLLLAAGQAHRRGHFTILGRGGGYILPAGSALARRVQQIMEQEAPYVGDAVPLYEERGTYVGYLRAAVAPPAADLCQLPGGRGPARKP